MVPYRGSFCMAASQAHGVKPIKRTPSAASKIPDGRLRDVWRPVFCVHLEQAFVYEATAGEGII